MNGILNICIVLLVFLIFGPLQASSKVRDDSLPEDKSFTAFWPFDFKSLNHHYERSPRPGKPLRDPLTGQLLGKGRLSQEPGPFGFLGTSFQTALPTNETKGLNAMVLNSDMPQFVNFTMAFWLKRSQSDSDLQARTIVQLGAVNATYHSLEAGDEEEANFTGPSIKLVYLQENLKLMLEYGPDDPRNGELGVWLDVLPADQWTFVAVTANQDFALAFTGPSAAHVRGTFNISELPAVSNEIAIGDLDDGSSLACFLILDEALPSSRLFELPSACWARNPLASEDTFFKKRNYLGPANVDSKNGVLGYWPLDVYSGVNEMTLGMLPKRTLTERLLDKASGRYFHTTLLKNLSAVALFDKWRPMPQNGFTITFHLHWANVEYAGEEMNRDDHEAYTTQLLRWNDFEVDVGNFFELRVNRQETFEGADDWFKVTPDQWNFLALSYDPKTEQVQLHDPEQGHVIGKVSLKLDLKAQRKSNFLVIGPSLPYTGIACLAIFEGVLDAERLNQTKCYCPTFSSEPMPFLKDLAGCQHLPDLAMNFGLKPEFLRQPSTLVVKFDQSSGLTDLVRSLDPLAIYPNVSFTDSESVEFFTVGKRSKLATWELKYPESVRLTGSFSLVLGFRRSSKTHNGTLLSIDHLLPQDFEANSSNLEFQVSYDTDKRLLKFDGRSKQVTLPLNETLPTNRWRLLVLTYNQPRKHLMVYNGNGSVLGDFELDILTLVDADNQPKPKNRREADDEKEQPGEEIVDEEEQERIGFKLPKPVLSSGSGSGSGLEPIPLDTDEQNSGLKTELTKRVTFLTVGDLEPGDGIRCLIYHGNGVFEKSQIEQLKTVCGAEDPGEGDRDDPEEPVTALPGNWTTTLKPKRHSGASNILPTFHFFVFVLFFGK